MANIVIYGAEISGICAAIKARGNLLADDQTHNIKIIVTNPSGKIGGLATRGALNCWDILNSPLMEYDRTAYNSGYKKPRCCQKGSFGVFLEDHYQSYRSDMDSEWLTDSELPSGEMQSMDLILEKKLAPITSTATLAPFGKTSDNTVIELIRAMDIVDIGYTPDVNGNKTIDKLYLREVHRCEDGYIRWGRKTMVVEGDYFIDASDDGKLTSALTAVTVGRYDWPKKGKYGVKRAFEPEQTVTVNLLEECEQTDIPVARQQVATLYFQVKDLVTDMFIPYGGKHAVCGPDNPVYLFNKEMADTNFAIKKYNLAKNSHVKANNIYWANTFLIFNVDGRAHYRDLTTKYYPKYMLPDSMHRDEAWVKGREVIGSEEFENALKGFDVINDDSAGCIVRDSNGLPIVAEQLYIRESVHLPLNPNNIGNGTENSNYAVKCDQSLVHFITDDNGVKHLSDYENEAYSIGLASYNADIHPYTKREVIRTGKGLDDEFLDMDDSANAMRPDLSFYDIGELSKTKGYIIEFNFEGDKGNEEATKNKYKINAEIHDSAFPATYLPYTAMLPYDVNNLLVVGNASSISSISWAEIRVLPNLCVLGDAAGVILAYAIRKNSVNDPVTLHSIKNSSSHLEKIRTILESGSIAPIEFADDTIERWWTNDAIVDKTDVVKRGHNRGDFDTDKKIK